MLSSDNTSGESSADASQTVPRTGLR